MKKIINSILVLTMLLSLNACKSGENDADKEYNLKMQLKKGDKFSQEMNMTTDMNISMMGMNKDMKMTMDMATDFEVQDSTAAGKQIKLTYSKMDMKMDMGDDMGVNSDSIMNASNKKLIGKSVVLNLEGNKVTDVKMNELNDTTDLAATEEYKKVFSKENINSMFGMMFNIYPGKPVKVGDTWTTENNMDVSGVNMAVKTTYKLLSVKDNIAELDVTGTIDSKGTMSQGGASVEMDMKGTQAGKMNVKVSDGYLKDGKYDMNIDATMNVMGQSIPMKMKATYTMTGK